MAYNPKYKKVFDALSNEPGLLLRGQAVLVEVLPKKELKTKGGLILGTVDTHRATSEDFRRPLGLVLRVGDDVDADNVMVGDVVLMPFNPLYLSEFPGIQEYTQNGLALINESDVIVKFTGLEALEKIEKQVEEILK